MAEKEMMSAGLEELVATENSVVDDVSDQLACHIYTLGADGATKTEPIEIFASKVELCARMSTLQGKDKKHVVHALVDAEQLVRITSEHIVGFKIVLGRVELKFVNNVTLDQIDIIGDDRHFHVALHFVA